MKMRAVSAGVWILGMLGAWTGPVPAQENTDEGPNPPLKLGVSVGTEWTDNRDASTTKEDNLDVWIRPRMDVLLYGEGAGVDGYYMPTFRYRSDPSDIQNDYEWYHDLGLNGTLKATPQCTLDLREKFHYTDNPTVEPDVSTVRRDDSYALNRVEGAATWEFAPLWAFEGRARHMMKSYKDSEVGRQSDEDSIGGGALLKWWVARTLRVSAVSEAEQFGYDSAQNRDFLSVFGGVGVENVFSPQTRALARVGVRQLEYDDESIDSQTGPYVDVAIQGSATPGTRLIAMASYMMRDSDVYPYASQEFLRFYGRLEWDVVREFTLAGSAAYRTGQYDQDTVPIELRAASAGGDETVVEVSAEALYRIGQDASLRLVQGFEDVDSDVSDSFTRNSTMLIMTFQFR
jgi:hypothetical protein